MDRSSILRASTNAITREMTKGTVPNVISQSNN